jgi:hypothetical protein
MRNLIDRVGVDLQSKVVAAVLPLVGWHQVAESKQTRMQAVSVAARLAQTGKAFRGTQAKRR